MISGDRSILAGKRGAFWYTLEELSKHWERIDIICPKNPSPPQSRGRGELLFFGNVYFHPSPWPLWRQPWWILEKGTELQAEHHHDVMTVHEYPPFYNGTGARWLHRSCGIPFCLEIHHIVGWPRASSLFEWIGCRLSRWVFSHGARSAVGIRVVNQDVKTVLTLWGIPAEKIHVVPSFYLDRHLLQPDPHVKKEYDVVFCGRLVANKGLLPLIDAVAKIPTITMLIIGDGPLKPSAEWRVRRWGISKRVRFLGWLQSQQEVIAAMQSARIFVMNSLSEGGPRTALEAMACGMPILTTHVGVMPEVIEDSVNGLFTTGEPNDLQEKITMVLGNEALRSRMGAEARKIVQKFERVKLIGEYAALLKSITH